MGANVSCACLVIFCDRIGTGDSHLNKSVPLTTVQHGDFVQPELHYTVLISSYYKILSGMKELLYWDTSMLLLLCFINLHLHRHGWPSEECFLQHVVLRENGCWPFWHGHYSLCRWCILTAMGRAGIFYDKWQSQTGHCASLGNHEHPRHRIAAV